MRNKNRGIRARRTHSHDVNYAPYSRFDILVNRTSVNWRFRIIDARERRLPRVVMGAAVFLSAPIAFIIIHSRTAGVHARVACELHAPSLLINNKARQRAMSLLLIRLPR